jgi:hypothetical protein
VQPDNEDEAWRAIVENYGERPALDPDDPPAEAGRATAYDEPSYDEPSYAEPSVAPVPAPEEEAERFVPPTPPPVPRTTPDRLAAWAGLFGAPVVLLVALVLNVSLPTWVGYVLVAWFVGGFLYLVLQMPSGPRDPGDDGARL